MKIQSVLPFVTRCSAVIGCVLGVAAVQAAPTAKSSPSNPPQAESNAVPRSVFVVPTRPDEGRDPFYPDSDRLFESKTTVAQSRPDVQLIYNGLSGTAQHRLAIINGHTFAEGETAAVSTSSGRVRIRCLQIKGATVTVEVGGQRRQLHFHSSR